jgi:hypothetical protein
MTTNENKSLHPHTPVYSWRYGDFKTCLLARLGEIFSNRALVNLRIENQLYFPGRPAQTCSAVRKRLKRAENPHKDILYQKSP